MRDLSELPDGWRLLRLEDVAEVNPRRPTLNIPIDVPTTFVPMAAVGENCRGVIAYQIRPYGEISKGYTYFENNDVLFAKITPCLQNGKHALVSSLKGGFGFGTTEFHTVRAGDRLEPRLLYRTLTQPQNILKCISSFAGTAGQQRVQPDVLRSLWLMLPPLAEQRAISDVLDAIDEAIERTEAVISATERLRDALLHELLTRGVPGWHTQWRTVPGFGAIPADWQVVRLGEVCDVTSGLAIGPHRSPRNNAKPYLTVANVQADHVSIGEPRLMEMTEAEYSRRILHTGDVVLVEGHAQIAELGRAALVPPEADGFTFQNHLFRVRPKSQCNAVFLCAYINSHSGRRYFESFGGTTSGLNTVSSSSVRSMPLPHPSIDEQRTIATIIGCVKVRVEREMAVRKTLGGLKASAGDMLLTGQVRVATQNRNN